jgi:predicted metal-dependent hydrolase
VKGARLWRAGRYREAHEVWEEAWRHAPRGSLDNRRWKGLCQAAAAVIQAQAGRWRGVARLGGRARDNLRAGGMEALAAAFDVWTRECVEREAWQEPPPIT